MKPWERVNGIDVFDEREPRKRRPATYAVVAVGARAVKTHAQLEHDERTICGRAIEYEIKEDRVPGEPGAVEPSCRSCRREIRRRAQLIQGAPRERLKPLGCPRCGRFEFRQTTREQVSDRCQIKRAVDGRLVYDFDDAPTRRVERVVLECHDCGAVVDDGQLVDLLGGLALRDLLERGRLQSEPGRRKGVRRVRTRAASSATTP
jgi:hypothetical protein